MHRATDARSPRGPSIKNRIRRWWSVLRWRREPHHRPHRADRRRALCRIAVGPLVAVGAGRATATRLTRWGLVLTFLAVRHVAKLTARTLGREFGRVTARRGLVAASALGGAGTVRVANAGAGLTSAAGQVLTWGTVGYLGWQAAKALVPYLKEAAAAEALETATLSESEARGLRVEVEVRNLSTEVDGGHFVLLLVPAEAVADGSDASAAPAHPVVRIDVGLAAVEAGRSGRFEMDLDLSTLAGRYYLTPACLHPGTETATSLQFYPPAFAVHI
jgi:hypothetical protein